MFHLKWEIKWWTDTESETLKAGLSLISYNVTKMWIGLAGALPNDESLILCMCIIYF